MPELPEVESIRALLEREVLDKSIVKAKKSTKALRKPLNKPMAKFQGKSFKSFKRWGKRLFFEISDPQNQTTEGFLDISLGMSGSFRYQKKNENRIDHDHLIFSLDNDYELIYNDPRRFGWISFSSTILQPESWDPLLGNKEQKERAIKKLRHSQKPLYSFLMDQTHISGLGNIYVQESLFRAGLKPLRLSCKTSKRQAEKLMDEIEAIIKEAVKDGGCTLKDHKLLDGQVGKFQKKLKVYGKKKGEPCLRCGAKLVHQSKPRTLTWCNKCQK